MIEQVMNRGWIRHQLGELERQLAEFGSTSRRGMTKLPPAMVGRGDVELSDNDFEEALVHVRSALARESVTSTGQIGFDPAGQERRGPGIAPLDDSAFFSRDPVVSNLQSALDAYLEQGSDPKLAVREIPLARGRRQLDSGSKHVVTDRTIAGLGMKSEVKGRRLFDKFSVSDPGWVSAAVAMGLRLFRKRHVFCDKPPEPVRISDNAQIIIVGDWGTGVPRAVQVANEIRKEIQKHKGKREQHVVHLGDVYYSGWAREYNERFLRHWPVDEADADDVRSYSLNGNHDMYSGGYGYYDCLLKDKRFLRQEGCSYFSFVNQNWKIMALDTAWDDNGLKDPQARWLQGQLRDWTGQTMLLSHHQLFSAYEPVGDVIAEKISSVLARGIPWWFWGHEHRCVLYKPCQNVQSARCIGHGGVPVYMTHGEAESYPFPAEYEYRKFIDRGLEHWALMGFAVLDFEGKNLSVRYIDENGTEHRSEPPKQETS